MSKRLQPFDPDESTEKLHSPPVDDSDFSENVTPYLLIIGGTGIGRMYELTETESVIGRSMDADVVIDDDGASRKHAKIRVVDDSVHVEDLGSTNGIFVNGKAAKKKVLDDGDRLRVGTTIFKLTYQDELEESFQKRLYDSAVRDPLTGAYNKRFFADSLRTEFAYSERQSRPLTVLMMDLDHFKAVNDEYGHLAGDYVLRSVAALITETLRTEDLLCRYGGEEFAIALRGTDAEPGRVVAERIRVLIEDHVFAYDTSDIAITTSIGLATLNDTNYESHLDLLRTADQKLYEAKEAGRNRVCVA